MKQEDADSVLKNPPKQLHALTEDMHPVENVETLMEYLQKESGTGDLVLSPDDAPGDPMEIYNEILNGGSW